MSYISDEFYDSEFGITNIFIRDKAGNTFFGDAYCHPDDKEHMSEYIGKSIAETRANIEELRHIRDTEIKPALKTLKHLYGNIKTSKHYNPKSYESKMIWRQIRVLESDLATIKDIINDAKEYIRNLSRN